MIPTITYKPWGQEILLETNEDYVVKTLKMRAGQRCSLQKHLKKRETIVVLENVLVLTIEGEVRYLEPYEFVTIEPGVVHRMGALDLDCLYLEASTPELNDVVRLEDDYSR